MALVGADYRLLILTQTGTQGNAEMVAALDLIWDLYADKAAVPRLRYRYALRDAIDLLLGMPADSTDDKSPPILQAVDWTRAEQSEKSSQSPDRLLKLHAQCTEEITRLEKIAAANRGPVVGPITATAPRGNETSIPPTPADPGYPGYKGDPIATTWPESLTRRP